jgi:hypothetical protein
MARTETKFLEAGFQAPDFTLPEPLTGADVNLREYAYDQGAKATLIMVICNHCKQPRRCRSGGTRLSPPCSALPPPPAPAQPSPPADARPSLAARPGPFVVHLKPALVQLAADYQPLGVKILAISANSAETHPQDGPDKMAEDALAAGYPFPYLYDASQEVAKSLQAACTPEFMVTIECCYV